MNNGETLAGLNLMSPGFQDVGLTSTTITGLKVKNATDGDPTSGSCSIQIIDENGKVLHIYNWSKLGRAASAHWAWAEGATELTDSTVFARGVGLLFRAEKIGDKLLSSGEVNLDGISFGDTLVGLNVIANPYPIEIPVKSLTVKNATDGDPTSGSCSIQIIDENGKVLHIYNWSKLGRAASAHWAWAEGATELDETYTVKPGQGILFRAAKEGDKLIFPSMNATEE